MQFKLDENLPPSSAELLRSLGHDVMTVYDQGLQSSIDPEVLEACQGEEKISFLSTWISRTFWFIPPSGTPGSSCFACTNPDPSRS